MSQFKINAKVDCLSLYDMIYIYHHIQIGNLVSLKPKETRLNGDKIYYAMFKEFTLGEVKIKACFNRFFNQENELKAEVTLLSKEKYLPIKSLDISIINSTLKMVS